MSTTLQPATNFKFVCNYSSQLELSNVANFSSSKLGGPRAAFFLLFISIACAFSSICLADTDKHIEVANDLQQSETISLHEAETGSLLIESVQPGQYHLAPTIDTDVNMDISGLVARVQVTQHFTNPSSEWVNGIYVFPLPENAAVDHMKMIIGERIIDGKIKQREEAKKIYTQAKREGKKASLVEQERPNIFTNSVANIGPNEKISVTIEYQQTLSYDQGLFSIRFPTVVGIRYIPGNKIVGGFSETGWAINTDEVTDANRITPHISPNTNNADEGHDNPVSINIKLKTGFPLLSVDSSYHPISKQMLEADHYEIQLANHTTSANRDFELHWRPQITQQPQAALFTQEKNNEVYALMMLMPPEVDWSTEQVFAKEMIYVIDTSGSMSGESMQQAKEALLLGLKQLRSEDWFNVIQFNSQTEMLSPHALPASENNIDRANNYVRSLQANGGTEIAPALNAALDNAYSREHIRQVIFLTDGSVGNEAALFKIIEKKLQNSRLFTVGIGSAPNSYFMSEAAALGRGTFTYIGDIHEVKQKMSALLKKLNHPVLSDLEIRGKYGPNISKIDYWPNPIQDLYIGEPLIVSLKLPKNLKNISISGKTNQSDWSTTLPIDNSGKAKGLNVLWARNKIQSLNQQISRGAKPNEIKQAITKLGLTHHIVTKHTSLVAVDITPTRAEDLTSRDKAIPVKKPHAWNMQVPLQIPQGATSAQINLLVGLFLLLAGFWFRKRMYA